jgi:hypothetical protein
MAKNAKKITPISADVSQSAAAKRAAKGYAGNKAWSTNWSSRDVL